MFIENEGEGGLRLGSTKIFINPFCLNEFQYLHVQDVSRHKRNHSCLNNVTRNAQRTVRYKDSTLKIQQLAVNTLQGQLVTMIDNPSECIYSVQNNL